MRRVLFLCTGNSCRSQMAEGFARALAPEGVRIWSAGVEAHGLDPRAVAAMDEVGVDIRGQTSKTLDAVPVGEIDTVITLCGDAAERCPIFPGSPERAHWDLPDPARASGGEAEIRAAFRAVRDEIRGRVEALFGRGGGAAGGR